MFSGGDGSIQAVSLDQAVAACQDMCGSEEIAMSAVNDNGYMCYCPAEEAEEATADVVVVQPRAAEESAPETPAQESRRSSYVNVERRSQLQEDISGCPPGASYNGFEIRNGQCLVK